PIAICLSKSRHCALRKQEAPSSRQEAGQRAQSTRTFSTKFESYAARTGLTGWDLYAICRATPQSAEPPCEKGPASDRRCHKNFRRHLGSVSPPSRQTILQKSAHSVQQRLILSLPTFSGICVSPDSQGKVARDSQWRRDQVRKTLRVSARAGPFFYVCLVKRDA